MYGRRVQGKESGLATKITGNECKWIIVPTRIDIQTCVCECETFIIVPLDSSVCEQLRQWTLNSWLDCRFWKSSLGRKTVTKQTFLPQLFDQKQLELREANGWRGLRERKKEERDERLKEEGQWQDFKASSKGRNVLQKSPPVITIGSSKLPNTHSACWHESSESLCGEKWPAEGNKDNNLPPLLFTYTFTHIQKFTRYSTGALTSRCS